MGSTRIVPEASRGRGGSTRIVPEASRGREVPHGLFLKLVEGGRFHTDCS